MHFTKSDLNLVCILLICSLGGRTLDVNNNCSSPLKLTALQAGEPAAFVTQSGLRWLLGGTWSFRSDETAVPGVPGEPEWWWSFPSFFMGIQRGKKEGNSLGGEGDEM